MEPTVLRLADIDALAENIARREEVARFRPTCVLFVDRAGRYLGLKLSEQLGCKALGIVAARKGSTLKKMLLPVLKALPQPLTHFLRRVELSSGIHAVQKERSVKFKDKAPAMTDRIVVVDDAVDSGYSLLSILDFLNSRGYQRAQVLTLAITVTSDTPVCQPDVRVFRHLITFPWSAGSEDFELHEKFLRLTDSRVNP